MIEKEDDASWITINGTHVQVDGSGNIITGPDSLKALSPRSSADSRDGVAPNGDKYAYHPATLGGMERGEPMTFEEADGRSANPGYRAGTGTASNCQSCVVAYEARLRGYDVEAQSYTKNATAEELAQNTRIAWVDPATGDVPEFEPWDYDKVYTGRSYGEYLDSSVKTGARYTLEFKWKGAQGGHIISVERDENGGLRLYDPQTGKTYTKDYERDALLNRMRFSDSHGSPTTPHLLRVDTLSFREDVVNAVVKEERAGWQRKTRAETEEDDWPMF